MSTKTAEIAPVEFSPEAKRGIKALVPDDHLYTWTIHPGSLIYRYYRWIFGREACDNINFCKLWWSVIFSPILILTTLVRVPARRHRPVKAAKRVAYADHKRSHLYETGHKSWNRYATSILRRDRCEWCKDQLRYMQEARQRHDRNARFVAAVGAAADRVVAGIQGSATYVATTYKRCPVSKVTTPTAKATWLTVRTIVQMVGRSFAALAQGLGWVLHCLSWVLRKLAWPVAYVGAAALIGSCLFLVGWTMYEWANHFAATVFYLVLIGGTLVGSVLLVVGVTAAMEFGWRRFVELADGTQVTRAQWLWDNWLWNYLDRLVLSWAEPTTYVVGRSFKYGATYGAKGTVGFFSAGYHMIKYRTCPKVKVIDDAAIASRTQELALRRAKEEALKELLSSAAK